MRYEDELLVEEMRDRLLKEYGCDTIEQVLDKLKLEYALLLRRKRELNY